MREGYYIVNDDDLYIKRIDNKNHELILTDDKEEAKSYEGGWYADVELEYIKFHFRDKKEVKTMRTFYYDGYDYDDEEELEEEFDEEDEGIF